MPAAASIRVLIVDDQQTMRMLVRAGLQQIGFHDVDDAFNGENALRTLIGKPPQLVISDYSMPVLDGIGLLRAVRAYPPTAKTAFIMLTGVSEKDLVQRAVSHGVSNFLTKPFAVTTLREKIEAVFGPLT
ncbi:MAG: response regulator [Gemmatimonadaceae bacterium]|nr:response regulator [Acetobacteraceae bacterium]